MARPSDFASRQIAIAIVLGLVTIAASFAMRIYAAYGPGESHLPFSTRQLIFIWLIPASWLLATLSAVVSAVLLGRGATPTAKLRYLWLWVLLACLLAGQVLRAAGP